MMAGHAQVQKNAPFLLQTLRTMHQSLLQLMDSVAFQQEETLISILLDLDAAQFGLSRVETRLELVNR